MPEIHARLLLTERDALLPLLRRTSADAFDRPTVCTDWSVRDVIAHCASALIRVATGTAHGFSPAENQADVDERRPWPIADVLAELEHAYELGAQSDAVALLALGEWVHGGDIREALG
ncbi:MAG: maleylpyruvate isomerase family mycothiol-dependent enzyme, partial [Actinomycetes bacterium]